MSFEGSEQLKKEFRLPLVAGTTCGEEMLRRSFKKKQIFGAKVDKTGPVTPAVPQQFALSNSTLGSTAASSVNGGSPSKTEGQSLTGRVLRFYGFTRESVQESNLEKERVRKITLCYFLEDGTISVSEPREDNSGFAFQGTLVKRHVIPDAEGRPITFDALSVGQAISFYGRSYVLTDADRFTRDFFASIGVTLGDAQGLPSDAYTTLRSRPPGFKAHDVPSIAATSALNITLSRDQINATKQFLANDRQVLRCDCTWNDAKNLYGEIHYLTLYYFLSDDTIAVIEKDSPNCGRDPFPNFVRRQRIPKPKDVSGKFENHNSSLTFKGKDKSASEFYTADDVRIGNVLHVFGRAVRICDYDEFTREHLAESGVTEYNPIDTSIPPKPKVVREPPPYNGFGDELDSLGSCQRLDIKPPRKDGSRFATHGNNVVKFAMKLENGIAADEIRRFVLSCFLADDTICIFEPVQRNSGIVGGKFLQRQKVANPVTGKPFVSSDFFVGLHVTINGFPFICTATDERSLNYMEGHAETFPHSNIGNVIHKIKAMLRSNSTGLAEAMFNLDRSAVPVDFSHLAAIAHQLNLPLSEQEILTILRFFNRQGESYASYEELISRVLPEGSVVGREGKSWEAIFSEMTNADLQSFNLTSATSEQDRQRADAAAARAAAQFLTLYAQRPALFNQEFKFAVDYATDAKIGEREFKLAAFERLHLPLDRNDTEALVRKLFPSTASRITFEDLHRLFTGNSNQNYNLIQIKNGGAASNKK